jgi:Sec-independent protein translocase protein TatA
MIEIGKLVAVVAVIVALLFGADKVAALFQAPAKFEAAAGANAAFKAADDITNANVAKMAQDAKDRKAASKKASENAGKGEAAKAAAIQATPAVGSTPVERAANRINSEFGT